MGFIVILVNLAYLVFSQVVGIITYFSLKKIPIFAKHTRKLKAFSFVVFLVVLLAPFWDLIIQKGIKTYYENYKMGYTINAYPEKDENGMIESLGVDRGYSTSTASYLINQSKLQNLNRGLLFRNFIEYYFMGSFKKVKNDKGNLEIKYNYSSNLGYARVYFDQVPITYEKIKDETEFKARYQVLAKTNEYYFYNETVIEFWDKKRNILMSKALKVRFPVQDAEKKFRTRYLVWWMSAAGSPFELGGLSNTYKVYKNLFLKDFKNK